MEFSRFALQYIVAQKQVAWLDTIALAARPTLVSSSACTGDGSPSQERSFQRNREYFFSRNEEPKTLWDRPGVKWPGR